MKLLAIETTCDETAAAVIAEPLTVLSSVVASQDELHKKFGGVVPEIASRAHVERILPVIDEALRQAETMLTELDAIAVATSPGLAGSLIVGLSAAKALCLATGKPLVAIDHLQAHIYSCKLAGAIDLFPCVGLVVSGGHTSLYRCDNAIEFALLGGTIDDAAGEAFDKIASLLGLSYPGGPSIEQVAAGGNPQQYRLPRSFIHEHDRIAFSFSGLKTAVRYQVAPPGEMPRPESLSAQQLADLAASFQESVIDCLVEKSLDALKMTRLKTLAIGGGVAANARFRARIEAECKKAGVRVFIAPRGLCTDNAAMGAIAIERLHAGLIEPLTLDVRPGLVR
ncbi:MAG: tRNA (adenosine(37)-N6)-threonylcarbamoyltransferase complex transferase subunit TsaD [Pirellulales bacterium]|nr:tRNA (adenosine(37)-N6)-threonylcarbamoyltransferase complex transferase subunit TsaD [Pirellulales bacterium]